jgi:hypothetical protein
VKILIDFKCISTSVGFRCELIGVSAAKKFVSTKLAKLGRYMLHESLNL